MATEVRHEPEASRYVIVVDGEVKGRAAYRLRGDDEIVFPHTVIAPDARGHGLGAELVRRALDDVRPTGRRVVPECWYVARFIDTNPDYADLLERR
ncbi:MAG TPA: GNAT family N-acetyltransferase [Microthrixaceae bacterium]|nr:GNAT family N-acetyltransferase [Microthrixaceae bacterium]